MILACGVVACFSSAHAAILFTGNNNANTSDPGNGLPWDSVARITDSTGSVSNRGTAVHLGWGYMITADHVSLSSNFVTFDGLTSHAIDTGFSPVQLDAPDADLKIFRLASNPGLPALNLYSTSEFGNQDRNDALSHMVGWGVGRDEDDTGNPWDWGGADTVAKRWGTNTATTVSNAPVGGYSTTALVTVLGNNQGDNEIAATVYDSGAGFFLEINGDWYLTGIAIAVEVDGSSNFGSNNINSGIRGNLNYYARIGAYESEILAIIPEPAHTGLILILGTGGWMLIRRRK